MAFKLFEFVEQFMMETFLLKLTQYEKEIKRITSQTAKNQTEREEILDLNKKNSKTYIGAFTTFITLRRNKKATEKLKENKTNRKLLSLDGNGSVLIAPIYSNKHLYNRSAEDQPSFKLFEPPGS